MVIRAFEDAGLVHLIEEARRLSCLDPRPRLLCRSYSPMPAATCPRSCHAYGTPPRVNHLFPTLLLAVGFCALMLIPASHFSDLPRQPRKAVVNHTIIGAQARPRQSDSISIPPHLDPASCGIIHEPIALSSRKETHNQSVGTPALERPGPWLQ